MRYGSPQISHLLARIFFMRKLVNDLGAESGSESLVPHDTHWKREQLKEAERQVYIHDCA